MNCECFTEMNKALEEKQGGRMADAFRLVDGTMTVVPVIDIVRKDTGRTERRRGRASCVIPTFCPFCGTQYEKGSAA